MGLHPVIDTAEGPRSLSTLFMGADGTTGLDLRNDQMAVGTAVQPDGLGGVYVADRAGAVRQRLGALPEGVSCSSLHPSTNSDIFALFEAIRICVVADSSARRLSSFAPYRLPRVRSMTWSTTTST